MWIQNGVTVQKYQIWFKIDDFFIPSDLEIWQMTLINNMTPLLSYFKLCASFHNHWGIQTGVTVWKCPIWVKINNFFSHVTLKFNRWPWKKVGHLSYATSSFVHHSVTICEFKVELVWKRLNWILIFVTLTSDLDLLHGHHLCHW